MLTHSPDWKMVPSLPDDVTNAGLPQRVIDTWLGHRSDRSMAAVYYRLRDEDSRAFMDKVPFGTGEPAADAGTEGV